MYQYSVATQQEQKKIVLYEEEDDEVEDNAVFPKLASLIKEYWIH